MVNELPFRSSAADDGKPPIPRKTGSQSSKPSKSVNRVSKRPPKDATNAASAVSYSHDNMTMDSRHKRVWKACERCRMKKTKCDGEFPCKRCKDDGLVCTAGVRKKVEYKQLPRGYAEVLENTQLALIATVHRLYAMVRNSESWDLGEPELNDRGQPVIHHIAQKLGCIRPNSDVDLPVHSIFPEDAEGMTALARQLDEQQRHEAANEMTDASPPSHIPSLIHSSTASSYQSDPAIKTESMKAESHGYDRASSSDLDHSDFEPEAQFDFATRGTMGIDMTVSPKSFGGDFDLEHEVSPTMFPTQSPTTPTFGWPAAINPAMSFNERRMVDDRRQYVTQPQCVPTHLQLGGKPANTMRPTLNYPHNSWMTSPPHPNINMVPDRVALSQGFTESNFGAIKPHHVPAGRADVMMGLGDPMIYSGTYEVDPMRL